MLRRYLPPLLLTALLFPPWSSLHAEDYESRRQELEAVAKRIEALDRRLAEGQGRRGRLQRELRASEQRLSETRSEVRRTRQRIAALRQAEAEGRAAVAASESTLARQQAALAAQLRAVARLGRQPGLRLLLEQDSPARLLRLRLGFRRLQAALAEQVAATREAAAEHAQRLAALSEQRADLARQEARQQEQLAQLQAAREEREAALAAVERRLADDNKARAEAAADEARLQALLAALREALADIPAEAPSDVPFASLRGQLPWPLEGELLARFGQPKAGGLRWNGLWLAAERGSPVRLVAPGRVAWAGWMHRYGLVVVVEHSGGYYSLYGHAEDTPAQVGQWLPAGATVARAGESGGQRRSGIYLELRRGADILDPAEWLQPRR